MILLMRNQNMMPLAYENLKQKFSQNVRKPNYKSRAKIELGNEERNIQLSTLKLWGDLDIQRKVKIKASSVTTSQSFSPPRKNPKGSSPTLKVPRRGAKIGERNCSQAPMNTLQIRQPTHLRNHSYL